MWVFRNLLSLSRTDECLRRFQSLAIIFLWLLIILLVYLQDRFLSEILLSVHVFPADFRYYFHHLLNFVYECVCALPVKFLIALLM